MKVEIKGYYRKPQTGEEYIHYYEQGREQLTNGVIIWGTGIKEKMQGLEPLPGLADFEKMKNKLVDRYPLAGITALVMGWD